MNWHNRSHRTFKKIWKRNQCPHCRCDLNKTRPKSETFYEDYYSAVEGTTKCSNCGCFLSEFSYGPSVSWWDHYMYGRSLRKREGERT